MRHATVCAALLLAGVVGCRKQLNFTIPICSDVDENCTCMVSGFSVCEHSCVNLKFDPENCGACGRSCEGRVCNNGVCADDCGSAPACDGVCTYEDDPHNCGYCGTACDGPCQGGQCRPAPTSTGELKCDYPFILCGGKCVDKYHDANNCGQCGRYCPTGCDLGSCCQGRVCNGICTDTSYDSSNCGSCGHRCTSGSYCYSGSCQ